MSTVNDRTGSILNGFVWKLTERSAVQVVKFIVQIILARLLLPSEFGMIALISVFIHVADVLVQSGLNTALIQKRIVDDLDYSTVLVTSFILAIFIYFVLYFTSPMIAGFYQMPLLVPIIRVLSLMVFLGVVNSVQFAYIARRMQFRLNFISSFIGVIISALISISMAYKGFGVWAIVAQQLISQFVTVVTLRFMTRKTFALRFSVERLRTLYSFGWKVMAASIVGTLTENIYSLLIGKTYNSTILGYYDRGRQFPATIMSSINTTIQTVLLPAFSAKQDSPGELKSMVRKTTMLSTFYIMPMMAGMIAIAKPLVLVLLTDKWIHAVPFIQLECLFYATLPVLFANGQAARAIGRSDISLKLEVIKTFLTIICLFAFTRYGIFVIVGIRSFISFCILIMSSMINKKLIGYTFSERMHDSAPNILLAIVMGVIVYCFSYLQISPLPQLFFSIVAGIIVYFGLAVLLKMQAMNYSITILKRITVRKGVSL
jgi:teichuronic acid exporter